MRTYQKQYGRHFRHRFYHRIEESWCQELSQVYAYALVITRLNILGEKEKQKQDVSARATDVNKHIDWFIFLVKL